MTRTTKIVLGVVGAFVILFVVVIATGAYMVMSAFQTEALTAQQATAAFTEVRQRFSGVTPAFTFGERGLELRRQPPATPPDMQPSTVHILVFDTAGGRLARIHLPLGLLKLGNSPIEFQDVQLQVEDVQRYGSTVLIDGDTPDGDPILVWTD